MKTKLATILDDTIVYCFKEDVLTKAPIPDYVIEIPKNPDHGHFATNLPLTLASSQKRRPLDIAEDIVKCLKDENDLLENAEVAAPGFINFKISHKEWYNVLAEIIRLKGNFGSNDSGKGKRVLVEFVSANPTGPLHLGHGRGAALGDTLCRILSFCGYDIFREFYINDAGLQLKLLGESILSRFKQAKNPAYPFPENGYHADYIIDLSKTISKEVDLDSLSENDAIDICSQKGKEIMLGDIKQSLSQFGVAFDMWYSESELFNSGQLQKTLEMLSNEGRLYDKDGAKWIKTSDFGDDKDRVIRKQDGQFTYFASDISYHLEKHARGFDKAINLWGADHHGYIPRMQSALKANGIQEDWLSVLLIQLVKLWKGGQEIKMSKRAGEFVTLQELVAEVGVDAVRFVFLTKNHDSQLDFDIDLVKKQDSDNPVYYVQYAHARICSIFRKAAEEGITLPDQPAKLLDNLKLDEEMALIRQLAEFPSLLVDISKALEPHRLTYYLTDIAASFHRYFNLGTKNPDHRIVIQDHALSQARLFLAEAIRTVIANGLQLLGITAPEKM